VEEKRSHVHFFWFGERSGIEEQTVSEPLNYLDTLYRPAKNEALVRPISVQTFPLFTVPPPNHSSAAKSQFRRIYVIHSCVDET
jgi:hypothetical protein